MSQQSREDAPSITDLYLYLSECRLQPIEGEDTDAFLNYLYNTVGSLDYVNDVNYDVQRNKIKICVYAATLSKS